MPPPILLATDGSPDARLAARAAADIARSSGAPLHVVHAWVLPQLFYGSTGLGVDAWMNTYESEGAKRLDQAVAALDKAGVKVASRQLREGRPADAIVAVARGIGASLVVIGSRGLGGVKRVFLGSVSEGVVHAATSPVLVVRGGRGAWPPGRLVVGDDGSDEALTAIQVASTMASALETPMMLVRAYPPRLGSPRTPAEVRVARDTMRAGETALRSRADATKRLSGVAPRIKVAAGDAAAVLVEEARAAPGSIVVVGTRGLGAVKRLALGSTSTKVLRGAAGPVLVCPPTGKRRTRTARGY